MATTFYLRFDASDIGGSGNLMMRPYQGWINGSCITNTTASGSNIQVTQTAGGTALSWYTFPLAAVTVSGTITPNLRGLESAVGVHGAPAIKIDHCGPTGTVLDTPVPITTVGTGWGTTDAASTTGITPTSSTLSAGDRLKITLYITNAPSQTMGTGNATTSINGQIASVAGDTYVTFTETLTEQVPVGIWLRQTALGRVYANSTPATATFPQSTKPGSFIASVSVSGDTSGGSGGTLSGGGVTSWTRYQLGVSENDSEIWGGFVMSGTTTLTFVDSGGANGPVISAMEWEGVNGANPVASSSKTTQSNVSTMTGPTLTASAGQVTISGGYATQWLSLPYQPNTSGWLGMQSGGSNTAAPTGSQPGIMAFTYNTGSISCTWPVGNGSHCDCLGMVLVPAPVPPIGAPFVTA